MTACACTIVSDASTKRELLGGAHRVRAVQYSTHTVHVQCTHSTHEEHIQKTCNAQHTLYTVHVHGFHTHPRVWEATAPLCGSTAPGLTHRPWSRGPKWDAGKIRKLMYTKDVLLNLEAGQVGGVQRHKHPCFFGSMEEVVRPGAGPGRHTSPHPGNTVTPGKLYWPWCCPTFLRHRCCWVPRTC